ncbi:immediate early protein 1 [Rat cytomegalovirus ALL-03]|uniref:Immediate early protein 1 n=2 Tax=Rat cytomegalovirus (isolate England) TaxID=1261657 RepID=A0A0F6R6P9_RCMVE|nr:immediate early protein 1 [Murid betaherpesvirus 8]AKE44284.1 immediate early protein 1 [Rat cytomegalovirus ALL-03]AFX83433.1 immediate early protein 1 [Murid betaherpesvirus 8]WEG71905.1 regulatory protein IE1 [Murid betaherpesvirus 8]WPH25295.1 regulatory protein IE1 [Murid betaherpesvirus 8]WPH25428.1 regulatory protein IE1 [Murid betaherpesvirus 8]
MDPTLFTQSRLLRVNDYDEVRESVNQPRQEQQPGDRCPRHVARIIAENDPPIRCDLTLQELLSEVQVDFEPSASEVVAMEGLMDEQHFIPHDPHSKKAAVQSLVIAIKTADLLLQMIHENVKRDIRTTCIQMANESYARADIVRDSLIAASQGKYTALGKIVFHSYTNFMPVNANESEKRAWMEMLGECTSHGNKLCEMANAQVEQETRDIINIMFKNIDDVVTQTTRAMRGVFDPPDTVKALSAAAQLIRVWEHDNVINDQSVSTSSVVTAALEANENLAKALRDVSGYAEVQFNRLCLSILTSAKERIDIIYHSARSQHLACNVRMNVAQQNLATFILTNARERPNDAVIRTRRAVANTGILLFTGQHITRDALDKAAESKSVEEIVGMSVQARQALVEQDMPPLEGEGEEAREEHAGEGQAREGQAEEEQAGESAGDESEDEDGEGRRSLVRVINIPLAQPQPIVAQQPPPQPQESDDSDTESDGEDPIARQQNPTPTQESEPITEDPEDWPDAQRLIEEESSQETPQEPASEQEPSTPGPRTRRRSHPPTEGSAPKRGRRS